MKLYPWTLFTFSMSAAISIQCHTPDKGSSESRASRSSSTNAATLEKGDDSSGIHANPHDGSSDNSLEKDADGEQQASGPLIVPDFLPEIEDQVKKYAPIIVFHTEEQYFPSSIEFFLEHTKLENDHYTSLESLGCDNCQNPEFLKGQRPEEKPPIYAFIIPKKDDIVDVAYFIFYPYNLGKEVCIGWDGLLLTGFFDSVADVGSDIGSGAGDFGEDAFNAFKDTGETAMTSCLGKRMRFGNHVGDWEQITVRFEKNEPKKVMFSAHDGGTIFNWKYVPRDNEQIKIYSAMGSHGSYLATGKHVYKNLPNNGSLSDLTNEGPVWNSKDNLHMIYFKEDNSYAPPYEWASFKGRWGNPKSGCDIFEDKFGECVLNPGPTGPMQKAFVRSQELK